MGMMDAPPAIEAGAPPDAQPQDLASALAQVDAIIFGDGSFGPDEQKIFAAFMAKLNMKMQAAQQQAASQQAQAPLPGGVPATTESELGHGGDPMDGAYTL